MKSRLAVTALNNAVARRGDVAGCVVHTDPEDRNFAAGSSSVLSTVKTWSDPWAVGDNAAMESFFSVLQQNVLNRQSWVTREELRIAIVTWIEGPIAAAVGRTPWAN